MLLCMHVRIWIYSNSLPNKDYDYQESDLADRDWDGDPGLSFFILVGDAVSHQHGRSLTAMSELLCWMDTFNVGLSLAWWVATFQINASSWDPLDLPLLNWCTIAACILLLPDCRLLLKLPTWKSNFNSIRLQKQHGKCWRGTMRQRRDINERTSRSPLPCHHTLHYFCWTNIQLIQQSLEAQSNYNPTPPFLLARTSISLNWRYFITLFAAYVAWS